VVVAALLLRAQCIERIGETTLVGLVARIEIDQERAQRVLPVQQPQQDVARRGGLSALRVRRASHFASAPTAQFAVLLLVSIPLDNIAAIRNVHTEEEA
jgi:hypothetical protein